MCEGKLISIYTALNVQWVKEKDRIRVRRRVRMEKNWRWHWNGRRAAVCFRLCCYLCAQWEGWIMEIVLLSALTFKLEAPVKQCEQSYINRYINFYRCGFAFKLCVFHFFSTSNRFSMVSAQLSVWTLDFNDLIVSAYKMKAHYHFRILKLKFCGHYAAILLRCSKISSKYHLTIQKNNVYKKIKQCK